MVVVVHTTVFGCITMTEDLIGCDSPVDYKSLADYTSLVTHRVAVKAMIVFVVERVAVLDKGFGLVVLLVH